MWKREALSIGWDLSKNDFFMVEVWSAALGASGELSWALWRNPLYLGGDDIS
jgi:hypothetical protein